MAIKIMHTHQPLQTKFEQLRGIIKNLITDNAEFVATHTPDYFEPFEQAQNPRATVITCSDARVHTQALDKTPDGDLFMIRNIGNQLITAEGSVEYGVRHLHTPLLIIVGHVACGAIKAAAGDYSNESDAIKRELTTVCLPTAHQHRNHNWLDAVKCNVNHQVAFAMSKFSDELKAGTLTVVGAVYDFQNAFALGHGKLVITNINGELDAPDISMRLTEIQAEVQPEIRQQKHTKKQG